MKNQWRRPSLAMHLFTALLVWCGVPASVQAQEVGDLAWFQEQWDAAIEWEPPANTFFRYRVETFHYVDRAEVSALEEEVRGHPEHPSRWRLKNLKRQIELGSPYVSEYRLWWAKDGWRFSRDSPQDDESPYHDVVVTDRTSWSLERDSLGIADPRRPPKGQDYLNYYPTLRNHLIRFVYAELGLGANTAVEFRPVDVRAEDGNWIGVVESANALRVRESRGKFHGGKNGLIINEAEMIKATDAPQFAGDRTMFFEWTYNDHLGREVSERVEAYDADGNILWRQSLIEASAFDHRQFRELSRTPAFGERDVLRGVVKAKSVLDARPGVRELVIRRQGRADRFPIQAGLADAPRPWIGRASLLGVIAVIGGLVGVRVLRGCRNRSI